MSTRLAVAGLGIYVVAVWAALGVTAITWFNHSAEAGTAVSSTSAACLAECNVTSVVAKGPRLVVPAN